MKFKVWHLVLVALGVLLVAYFARAHTRKEGFTNQCKPGSRNCVKKCFYVKKTQKTKEPMFPGVEAPIVKPPSKITAPGVYPPVVAPIVMAPSVNPPVGAKIL